MAKPRRLHGTGRTPALQPIVTAAWRPLLLALGSILLAGTTAAQVRQPGSRPRLVLPEFFEGDFSAVAFSPDGGQVLTAGSSRIAILWEWAGGKPVQVFRGQMGTISSAAFSPDGRRVVAGLRWDGKAILWEVLSGEKISDREGVVLWDLHSGQRKASWETGGDGILAACFSPDGHSVAASRSSNTVTFWEIETGKVVRTFEGHEDKVTSVAFSRCGKYLLTGGKGGLASLWDISTGKVVQTHGGASHPAYWARFAAGGKRIVARSNDCSACIYDTQTGQTLARLYSLNKCRDWLTVTPQGYLDGSPGALKLLQWEVGNERVPFERYEKTYHRPDLVARALEGLAVEEPQPAAGSNRVRELP